MLCALGNAVSGPRSSSSSSSPAIAYGVGTPDETALCWESSRTSKTAGYWNLHVRVFEAPVRATADLLAEVPTQYSNPDTIERMKRWWSSVADRGYDKVYGAYDHAFYNAFRIEWQEFTSEIPPYDKSYCGHHVESVGRNDTYEAMKKGMAFLDRVVKKMAGKTGRSGDQLLDDPRNLVETLGRMGAVRVERLDRESAEPGTLVRATGRRPRLRTEGILSLFGS